jgi:hypothetical protein
MSTVVEPKDDMSKILDRTELAQEERNDEGGGKEGDQTKIPSVEYSDRHISALALVLINK